jgi:hypothetical protein
VHCGDMLRIVGKPVPDTIINLGKRSQRRHYRQ